MILLYPLRPVSLFLLCVSSFLIWLLFRDIFSFLVMLSGFPLIACLVMYFKYQFLTLERFANGHTGTPALSWDHFRPFTEMRQYQVLLVLLFTVSLAAWLIRTGMETVAWVIIAVIIVVLPAFIGMLGVGNGFFASLNPFKLGRFMRRTGFHYVFMCGLLFLGPLLIRKYFVSGQGMFTTVFISLYLLDVVFIWLGMTIFARHEELGYLADLSPERAARRGDEELRMQRRKYINRYFKEKHMERAYPALLVAINLEEDRLAAHAWYYHEMLGWDNKRYALRHAVFYIRELRLMNKDLLADLIVQECRVMDPDFDGKIPGE